jgi:hypothetical protein
LKVRKLRYRGKLKFAAEVALPQKAHAAVPRKAVFAGVGFNLKILGSQIIEPLCQATGR